MIDNSKKAAIQLREAGYSIKSIATELGAAQSSVSIWVRNVPLSEQQRLALRANTHSKTTIEKRRQSRLKNELAKRTVIMKEAEDMVANLSKRELWLIGTGLYWAEGAKKQRTVQFSNGDPHMIQLMMRYFREICNVQESKIRGCIHIHESLDVPAAEEYWHKITAISKDKFYKTYNKNKPNKSSKGKRHSLPYGVCDVYVLDAKLLLQIKGWIDGIYDQAIIMVQ